MLVTAIGVAPPLKNMTLRWRVDHEDAFLAVNTTSENADDLENIPIGGQGWVKVEVVFSEVFQVEVDPISHAVEWYANALPYGRAEGYLIEAEVSTS